MPKLAILEDNTIKSMLRNPKLVAEFPFLKSAAEKASPKKRRGCNCSAKNRNNTSDFATIKVAIAALTQAKKAKLKELLEVDQVRVFYKNTKNQIVKMTF